MSDIEKKEAEVKAIQVDAAPVTDEKVKSSAGNDFIITKGKFLYYFGNPKITSKIFLGDDKLDIVTEKKVLYFINTASSSNSIDYETISKVEVKPKFTIWYLFLSAFVFISSALTFSPLLLVLIPIFLIFSYSKKIVISHSNIRTLVIPADAFGKDKAVIKDFCIAFRKRAQNLPEIKDVSLNDLKIAKVLPFKAIIDKIVPPNVENPVVKKLVPYANAVGVGLISIIVFIIIAANSATARLEDFIKKDIIAEKNVAVKSVNLIKIQKGIYTGNVEVETIYGTEFLTVTVVTDGRNYQWEIEY
jgi:hypothetical protein